MVTYSDLIATLLLLSTVASTILALVSLVLQIAVLAARYPDGCDRPKNKKK